MGMGGWGRWGSGVGVGGSTPKWVCLCRDGDHYGWDLRLCAALVNYVTLKLRNQLRLARIMFNVGLIERYTPN